jgi:hypothetical protein
MDVKEMVEFCGEFGRKLDISVRYDFAGNAIVWYHVTGIEEGDSFRINGL